MLLLLLLAIEAAQPSTTVDPAELPEGMWLFSIVRMKMMTVELTKRSDECDAYEAIKGERAEKKTNYTGKFRDSFATISSRSKGMKRYGTFRSKCWFEKLNNFTPIPRKACLQRAPKNQTNGATKDRDKNVRVVLPKN
uniref:Secreted protein n=1 Tax=Anopheles minimus TaxID=112268 RepID=A0A182WQ10_9DIPT